MHCVLTARNHPDTGPAPPVTRRGQSESPHTPRRLRTATFPVPGNAAWSTCQCGGTGRPSSGCLFAAIPARQVPYPRAVIHMPPARQPRQGQTPLGNLPAPRLPCLGRGFAPVVQGSAPTVMSLRPASSRRRRRAVRALIAEPFAASPALRAGHRVPCPPRHRMAGGKQGIRETSSCAEGITSLSPHPQGSGSVFTPCLYCSALTAPPRPKTSGMHPPHTERKQPAGAAGG